MNPAASAVSWYLRSMGDHDTHRGERRTDSTVVAACRGSASGVYVFWLCRIVLWHRLGLTGKSQ
jgi:hypothetical protein